jgi:hypothetical protein
MKTVLLHGAKAAGRVTIVDDEDYDLVMQYRWHIHDPEPKPGRRRNPYAVTNAVINGTRGGRMHALILGVGGGDHIDHDGLNNQRYNLRPATPGENARNTRPRLACSSQFKGVCFTRRKWLAYIDVDGCRTRLGHFVCEIEAAYAYDAAARALHGEFACPNFPEGPTQAMRDQWQSEREKRKAALAAARASRNQVEEFWAQREPDTFVCGECGEEYRSRAVGKKSYCGKECRQKVHIRRKRERRHEERRLREEGRLF